ncbi:MAG: DUF1698 domain-containing protein [Chlamydiae bacterium]|nr:DUF1698 domain-containing protein [Chlamydiota bacterium]MBI3277708.1 DUF1698 domain-containing protein [Chlamydiota bacterium]
MRDVWNRLLRILRANLFPLMMPRKNISSRFVTPSKVEQNAVDISSRFVTSSNAEQNAVDIFKGEWVSQLPQELNVQAGKIMLFDDARIKWVNDRLCFQDKSVLELGSLEGGHSYLMEKCGALRIVAIESNMHAYLRCLIAKELLKLKRVEFFCVDCMQYLQHLDSRFGIVIASGILYHMQKPVELLELICKTSDSLFLWTHYYDETLMQNRPTIARSFSKKDLSNYKGFSHTLYRNEYGASLDSKCFLGSNSHFSCWMSREEIVGALGHFGMNKFEFNFENEDHPNGPSFGLIAMR